MPTTVTTRDLSGIAPGSVPDEYARRGVAQWHDDELVAAAGRVLAPPRAAPANSFVLHAPLELLARAALLPLVAPAAREGARARIVGLAAGYEAAGDPVDPPAAIAGRALDALARDLVAAIGAGDLDTVDAVGARFGALAEPADLQRCLGDALAPALAAAGHAPILLNLFPRVDLARVTTRAVLRGPAREIARNSDWRIRWHESAELGADGPPLLDALLAVPQLGLPGSDFIFPVMHQVESAGVPDALFSGVVNGPIDVVAARRTVARVAAWSMLQEPDQYAPYGWTHCLTMPQAVMGIAGAGVEPRTAVAVAATFVAGFRAALGTVALDPAWQPEPFAAGTLTDALADGPDTAAAMVWHAPDDALASITTELVSRAALHHDAHLVKYTLACLHAAQDDSDARRLFLAAAASLSAFWARLPDDDFFAD